MGEHDSKHERDMKAEYSKLQQKHQLPSLDVLDREFSVGQLDQTGFALRSVANKMQDRCDYVRKMLGDLIQPDNHIADMQEAESLGQAEKKKVFEIFRKLSYYSKELVLQDLDYDEKACAELIKKLFAEWAAIKPDLVSVLSSARDTWNGSKVSRQDSAGYFG